MALLMTNHSYVHGIDSVYAETVPVAHRVDSLETQERQAYR